VGVACGESVSISTKNIEKCEKMRKKVEKCERHAETHHVLASLTILVNPFHMEGGVGVACGEFVSISGAKFRKNAKKCEKMRKKSKKVKD